MADRLTSLPMFVTPLMSLWLDLTSGLGVRQKRYCLESCGCRELTFPKTDLANPNTKHRSTASAHATTDNVGKLPGCRGACLILLLHVIQRCHPKELRWFEEDLLQAQGAVRHVLHLRLEEYLVGLIIDK